MLFRSGPPVLSGMGYAPYSMGNSNNTYQGVLNVDKDGKEIHYSYPDGRLVDHEEDIFKSCEEGSFVIGHGIALENGYKNKYKIALIDHDLWQKTLAGEYQQPFYNDFPAMSETSRRLIFGMMLAHEGKCRVPIYQNLTAWGFDPDKDMLQYAVGDYSRIPADTTWLGASHTPPNWLSGGGGYLVDWRLMTSLPGLFAAGGGPLPGSGCHGESHTTGRYAGRQAAVYASQKDAIEPDAAQIAAVKQKVYAVINTPGGDIGWKEFNYAVARIVQDYCGEYKTLHTLDMGIRRMRDLMETEGERMYAGNPHELARVIESLSVAELGIALMEAAKARKGNVPRLGFKRTDLAGDEAEGNWNPIHLEDGKVVSRHLSVNYHLQEPYAPTLAENYQRYAEV